MPGVILQCKAYLANLGQQQQPQEQPPMPNITSTIVRPIPNKIQLWKPWMYSASLYQDWLARLTSSTTTAQLEPAQYLNFSAIGNLNNTQHHPDSKPATNSTTEVVTTAEQVIKKIIKNIYIFFFAL